MIRKYELFTNPSEPIRSPATERERQQVTSLSPRKRLQVTSRDNRLRESGGLEADNRLRGLTHPRLFAGVTHPNLSTDPSEPIRSPATEGGKTGYELFCFFITLEPRAE